MIVEYKDLCCGIREENIRCALEEIDGFKRHADSLRAQRQMQRVS